ncbi:MAG: hypothetical protein ACREJM_10590, partial [Candidatus Saccharimonadales bacterium]
LPAADQQRFKRLIANSERGELRTTELKEYRVLGRRVEALDSARLAALAQLAHRWAKPVDVVLEIVGWEDGDEMATRHPAGSAKARPRSGR